MRGGASLRILPYIKDMRVKSLKATSIVFAAVAVAPSFAIAQGAPAPGNPTPAMYGSISGPSSVTLGANIVIDVMGKDQDQAYIPGYSYIDPETGQQVNVPERFETFDSHHHDASQIVLDEEGFGLGTLVSWSLQQNEPGGVRRWQAAVKVTSVMTTSGFGKIIVTYDDTVHVLSPYHDESIILTKTIGLVQP